MAPPLQVLVIATLETVLTEVFVSTTEPTHRPVLM